MRWREIDPPSNRKHKFRIIGEFARNWNKAKLTDGFDDILHTFKHKYRIDVSYEMNGMAFYSILHNKSLRLVIEMNRVLERNNDVRRF